MQEKFNFSSSTHCHLSRWWRGSCKRDQSNFALVFRRKIRRTDEKCVKASRAFDQPANQSTSFGWFVSVPTTRFMQSGRPLVPTGALRSQTVRLKIKRKKMSDKLSNHTSDCLWYIFRLKSCIVRRNLRSSDQSQSLRRHLIRYPRVPWQGGFEWLAWEWLNSQNPFNQNAWLVNSYMFVGFFRENKRI